MLENMFFKENLYNFLSRNDSMFNKYETDSIIDYSYINSKELLMDVKFKLNYGLYLKFKLGSKYEIFSSIEEYFNLVDSFIKNEKINESHFLFVNNNKVEINKNKINHSSDFKFSSSNEVKKGKQMIKKEFKIYDSLINAFKEIINEINKNPSLEHRIIVENYDDYLFLINFINKSKIKIKFNEYKYLKDYKIYKEILKYLSKNEFDKIKLRKLIVNTSDYYEIFFNYFINLLIDQYDDKYQFLFYFYLYKDFYLIKRYECESNIEIEPFEFVSVSHKNSYMILYSKNLKLSKEEIKFYLERLLYIDNNIKFYKKDVKKTSVNKNYLNILNIINDDK